MKEPQSEIACKQKNAEVLVITASQTKTFCAETVPGGQGTVRIMTPTDNSRYNGNARASIRVMAACEKNKVPSTHVKQFDELTNSVKLPSSV